MAETWYHFCVLLLFFKCILNQVSLAIKKSLKWLIAFVTYVHIRVCNMLSFELKNTILNRERSCLPIFIQYQNLFDDVWISKCAGAYWKYYLNEILPLIDVCVSAVTYLMRGAIWWWSWSWQHSMNRVYSFLSFSLITYCKQIATHSIIEFSFEWQHRSY